jgi:hypothetical protein
MILFLAMFVLLSAYGSEQDINMTNERYANMKCKRKGFTTVCTIVEPTLETNYYPTCAPCICDCDDPLIKTETPTPVEPTINPYPLDTQIIPTAYP